MSELEGLAPPPADFPIDGPPGEIDAAPEPTAEPTPEPKPAKPELASELAERGFKSDAFSADDADFVEQAKAMGWTEPERFKGDAKGYVGAKRFVERGRASPAAVRKQNDDLTKQLEAIKKTQDEIAEYHRRDKAEAVQRAYKQAMEAAQQRELKAIQSGDVQGFQKAKEDQEQLIREDAQREAAQAAPAQPPEFMASWKAQNEWYGTDQARTAMAEGMAEAVANEGYQGQALLNEVGRRVLEAMPLKGETVAPGGAFKQSTGGPEVARATTATPEAVIPAEARAAFSDFLDDFGPKGSAAQYKTEADAKKAFLEMFGE